MLDLEILEVGKPISRSDRICRQGTRFENRIMLREGGWYVETESAIVITSRM